jgi:hypothetical protein
MERFLIDDGIKQSKIVANRYKWSIENADMGSEDANELHADICNQYVKEYEQIAEWLEELKSYKDIGTLKELKELKENGTFTGLELTKLSIMQKELKKYKDLEEQGLLVRFPCKVGTEVYYILGIPNKTPCTIDKCVFELSDIDKIGESLFLTREETEKKLEELKNEI